MSLTAWLAITLVTAALFAGPAIVLALPDDTRWRSLLHWAVLTMVVALCLLRLIPHALHEGGVIAGLVLVATLGASFVIRRVEASAVSWVPAILLAAHAVLEGVVIMLVDASERVSVTAALVAHRIPVAVALFVGLSLASGRGAAWLGLVGMTLATLLGSGLAQPLVGIEGHPVTHAIEAAVAGALLHLVFHTRGSVGTGATMPWTAAGAVLGAGSAGAILYWTWALA